MPKPLTHRLDQVKAMAVSATARNSAILFGGNIANTLLSMVAVIFVSRALGPADFGVLAVFNTLMLTLVGITDFGLGTTAIRLISKYLASDKQRAIASMKVLVKLELLTGAVVGLVGLIFAKEIANLLGGQQMLMAVRFGFIAGIFATAAAFYGPFFVAYEQFVKNLFVNLSGAVMRVGAVLLLMGAAALTLNNIIITYMLVPIAFFFIGLAFVPKDFMLPATRKEQRAAFSEIFHFSKWIFLSYVATSLAGRLDIFLLAHFQGSQSVGLYAAAQQLVQIMPMLVGAITTVLLPQVSRMTERVEFVSFIKKTSLAALMLCIAMLPILIFAPAIIQLIFGSKFSGSLSAFVILFAAYLLPLFANPISLVIFAKNRPQLLTFVNYGQLTLTIVLNLILIPIMGMNGAAWAFFVSSGFGAIASILLALRELNRPAAPLRHEAGSV
jgi:O-antigen/teichoic acid export membrane protein